MITQSYDAPLIKKTTTAADLQTECETRFPDVLSAEIGLFKKWRLSRADVCGAVRYVSTRAMHIRKAETDSVCEELEELVRQDIVVPFRSKIRHLIPWFSVNKRGQLARRIVMDFRAVNCLATATPAVPLDRDGAIEIVAGKRYYTKVDLTSGYFQIGLVLGIDVTTCFKESRIFAQRYDRDAIRFSEIRTGVVTRGIVSLIYPGWLQVS